MRRKALLAASAASGGGQTWAYELHLTAKWEDTSPMYEEWMEDGDYTELYQFLVTMTTTLGEDGGSGMFQLFNIPNECNITVDGYRLEGIDNYGSGSALNIYFGSGNISGTLSTGRIFLDKVKPW